MIPKTKAYQNTKVSRVKNKANIEDFLGKFGIREIYWNEQDPKDSFFVFRHTDQFGNSCLYKVSVPFVEKEDKRTGKKEYHEERSYAYLWHIMKAMMNMTDLEMSIEETFSSYQVVDKSPDGQLITLKDKMMQARLENKVPQLSFDGR